MKAVEELNELSTRLMQSANKEDGEMNLKILEELVDAQMHLFLLQKLFLPEQLRSMVGEKVEKFIMSKDFQFYLKQ